MNLFNFYLKLFPLRGGTGQASTQNTRHVATPKYMCIYKARHTKISIIHFEDEIYVKRGKCNTQTQDLDSFVNKINK